MLEFPEVDGTRTVKAKKLDAGKPRVELLPGRPLMDIARVIGWAAEHKYSVDDWRGGLAWRRLVAAAVRHLFAFLCGEDNDPESGLPHVAHAATNCLYLLEYGHTHPELDDRFKGHAPLW